MTDMRNYLFERAINLSHDLATADDPDFNRTSKGQDAVKKLLVCVWRMLHPQNRARFVAALDEKMNINLTRQISDKEREEAEIAKILTDWPQVLGSVSKDDRGFAMSIMKNRSKQSWWPSEAQLTRMKSMWAERSITGADIEVTE